MARSQHKGGRRAGGAADTGRAGELAVSRIEQHHVDALAEAGGDWATLAASLLERRSTGEGSAMVAAVDGRPVGLLGFTFGDDGWTVTDLAVLPDEDNGRIREALLTGADQLARFAGGLQVPDELRA